MSDLDHLYSHYISVKSPLEKARLAHSIALPVCLQGQVALEEGDVTSAAGDSETIQKLFPNSFGQRMVRIRQLSDSSSIHDARVLRVGIVLSGGPAPGGHNVICGLFHYLQRLNPRNQLFGFIDGVDGILKSKFITITPELCASFLNQGGFHMIGSGRGKIDSEKQKKTALSVCQAMRLNGLVVVGGDDSNTNAAVLAEYFLAKQCPIRVCGVPKTIDGDLRNDHVEVSFGFDTATKVYAETVAALCADAASAKKVYHICRLMGRTASHITLEVALQAHPNVTLIGEECLAKQMGLRAVVSELADVVCQRALLGRNYGVFILPEGLVDFLPDVSKLLHELNEVIAANQNRPPANLTEHLSAESKHVFRVLPPAIAQQLLLDRDPHGNVQVSQIESERLIAHMLESELHRRAHSGDYVGKFKFVCHFLGYQGRCGLPSQFDASYCFALGATAGVLIHEGRTGQMAIVRNTCSSVAQWQCGGMPLTHMMNVERRHGKDKPVIKKALVELDSVPFKVFARQRDEWKHDDKYRNPGPIQFDGDMNAQLNMNLTTVILQHRSKL